MTTSSNPGQPQQGLTPDSLAEQLFNIAISQNTKDPHEAGRQVIEFIASSLFYAIKMTKNDIVVFLTDAIIRVIHASSPDDSSRRELIKHVSDIIAASANATAQSPAAVPAGTAPAPAVAAPAAQPVAPPMAAAAAPSAKPAVAAPAAAPAPKPAVAPPIAAAPAPRAVAPVVAAPAAKPAASPAAAAAPSRPTGKPAAKSAFVKPPAGKP